MFRSYFLLLAVVSCLSLSAMQQDQQDPCKQWRDFVHAAVVTKHLDKTTLQEVAQQVAKLGCQTTSGKVPAAHAEYYRSAGAQVYCPYQLMNAPGVGWYPRYANCCRFTKKFGAQEEKE